MFSTLGDVEYVRGCSVHRGIPGVHREDILNTLGDVQYMGIPRVHPGMFSTLGGYHEYIRGIP